MREDVTISQLRNAMLAGGADGDSAFSVVLTFGGYKGETLGKILADHPRYALWMLEQEWFYTMKYESCWLILKEWQKYYIAAVSKTEIWQIYWQTDIPTKEIAEAYGINHHSHVAKVAGPKNSGVMCEGCGDDLICYSRSTRPKRYCPRCTSTRSSEFLGQWEKEHNEQQVRIAELSAMPYEEYLRTPEWAKTRNGALYRAGYRCMTCANPNGLHVHHRTYARRGQELARDLVVLCSGCHGLFHENGRLVEQGRADQ